MTGATDVLSSRERVQGYEDAIAELGVALDSELICTHSFTADFAYMAVSALLRGAQPADRRGRRRHFHAARHPAGRLDRAAAHSSRHLRHRRGDSDLAELIKPPMTVVRWSYSAVGEAGAKLVIDRIKIPDLPRRQLRFPTELLIRKSCAPPKKG